MKDDLNIDEFEDWLKGQADKHRMFPNDQLWRNINQQLHEQQRWPALTFAAILTGALVTATLIFLHPNKNLLTVFAAQPVSNTANSSSTLKTTVSENELPSNTKPDLLKPIDSKTAIYSFNYTNGNSESGNANGYTVLSGPGQSNTSVLENSDVNSSATSVNSTDVAITKPAFTTPVPAAALYIEDENATGSDAKSAIAITGKPSSQSAIADAEEALNKAAENAASKKIQLPKVHKSRWNVEVYGGSNISYRRLSEPSSYDYHLPYNQALASTNHNNVNNVVKQHPSVGFNAGVAFTYPISNRLTFKTGFQLNFRQYNIDAFHSTNERSVLLLNNGYFYPDSVYTYSAISNETGRAPVTLSNRYYQLSIPVGVEWTAVRLHNLSFSVAANVQPTYQLNGDVYMISSDYKSYVQAPGLLRRLNMNAGAEVSANFQAGGLHWQVGPQLMYQVLSTQKSNYSIREHLIDYGVRVGVVKQIR